jgi:hypothetical protein
MPLTISVAQGRTEPFVERIVSREQPVGSWDLSTSRDAKLLTNSVRMRLRRSRGDPEAVAHLVVGASFRDKRDNLALPAREIGKFPMKDLLHATTLAMLGSAGNWSNDVIASLRPRY